MFVWIFSPVVVDTPGQVPLHLAGHTTPLPHPPIDSPCISPDPTRYGRRATPPGSVTRPTTGHGTPPQHGSHHEYPLPHQLPHRTPHEVTPMRVCSTPGCPTLHHGTGKCPGCIAGYDRARRPNGNPYTTTGHRTFRAIVLTRDPTCMHCGTRPSTVADHHPLERWQLIEQGLDPNDPKHGQGLCSSCHSSKTARTASDWSNPNREH